MVVPRLLTGLTRFLQIVLRNIVGDRVFFRAGSLAFTSILSFVPLTMVVFAFGGFDQFSSRLLESVGMLLLPEHSSQLLALLEEFTSNARRLGTWGTLLFLITAVTLFNSLETHLNDIFRTRPRHGLFNRIALYIASIALISVVFGAGFGPVSGMMEAWSRSSLPGHRTLGIILSTAGTMIGLITIFSLMSAARLKPGSVLIGSFIGSLFFHAAKSGFAVWTAHSVRQSVIYGSLVFFPLLLIWLDVAWVVILATAEIIHALQSRAGSGTPFAAGTPAAEAEQGWRLFLAICNHHKQGNKPPDLRTLARSLGIDERSTAEILRRFEDHGLLHRINAHPAGYVPYMAPTGIPASRVVFSAFGIREGSEEIGTSGRILADSIRRALSGRTVDSFLPGKDRIPYHRNTGTPRTEGQKR